MPVTLTSLDKKKRGASLNRGSTVTNFVMSLFCVSCHPPSSPPILREKEKRKVENKKVEIKNHQQPPTPALEPNNLPSSIFQFGGQFRRRLLCLMLLYPSAESIDQK